MDIINQKELTTGYFNTPKPFCVHNSVGKSTEEVLGYVKKMFVSDRSFYPAVESNPFFVETLGKEYLSPVYINTLKGLFVSVNNNFPDYGRYSELNMDLFKSAGYKQEFLDTVYRDYTGKFDELIDKAILAGHRE